MSIKNICYPVGKRLQKLMKDGNKPGLLVAIFANWVNHLDDMAVKRFNYGYLATSHVCCK